MKKVFSIGFVVVLFLAGTLAVDADVAPGQTAVARYEALMAANEGMSALDALSQVLADKTLDNDQVSALVARVAQDTNDPAAAAETAVKALLLAGNEVTIEAAVNAALAKTDSVEQATQVAKRALAALPPTTDGAADPLRSSIVSVAENSYGVDPINLQPATASTGNTGPGSDSAPGDDAPDDQPAGPPSGGDSSNSAPGTGSSGGGSPIASPS